MFNRAQTQQLVKHLRAITDILEKSAESPQASQNGEATQSKRGRKPGVVADNVRCQGQNADESRCKNRATQGTHCKKHVG